MNIPEKVIIDNGAVAADGGSISEAYTKEDYVGNTHEKPREFDGPCQVCGRPGYTQAHPSAPVSVVRCEKHSATRTFNPIYAVMAVFGLSALGIVIYLINLLFKEFL